MRIAGGEQHTLAVGKDGSLWAWGRNDDRQLGVGTPEPRGDETFGPFEVGFDRDWVAVAAGDRHSLALKSGGSIWAWGSNAEGQCGTGPTQRSLRMPVRIGEE